MVPISNILKYTFRQEGLRTEGHKHILQLLELHNNQPYCEYLKDQGELDSCAKVEKSIHEIKKKRTPGNPFASDKGENKMCGKYGVVTELCAAGADPTCNGNYQSGHCESFDIKPDHGYWQPLHKFGKY